MAARPASHARAAGLLAGGALLCVSAAAAQETPADACALTGAGRVAMASRRVRNPDSAAVVLLPQVALPAGWRLAVGAEPLSLPRRGAATWVLGLIAPSGARAGDYRVGFALRSAAVGSRPSAAADSGALCVRVAAQVAAELQVRPHGVLVAGDSARVAVVVRNTGNVAARLRLDATGVVGFARAAPEAPVRVRVDARPVALEPGDSVLVAVDVLPDRGLPRSGTLRLHVEAHVEAHAAGGARGDGAVASGTRELLVVPPAGRGLRRAPQLPLRVALRAGAGRAVAPAEIAGEGAVGGGVRVELLARGPAPVTSPIGERSEYRLDVASETRRLTLGDQTFALSPLLERGHGAFGAQARAQAGRVGLQAFAGRNRWWAAGGTEAGGRVSVHAGGGVLALHALDRRGSPRDDGTAASLSGNIGGKGGRVEVEAAGAQARGPFGHPGWAARGQATGRVAGAAYDVELSRASAFFPGYLRGAGTAAAELRHVSRHTDLSFGARQDRVGGGTLVTPELLVGALVLPSERRRAVTAQARLFGVAAVTLRAADRTGRAGALAYDGSERSVAVELTRRLGPLGAAVDAAWGVRDDRRRATRSGFERAGARLEVALGSHLSARLFADREHGATLWSSAALSTTLGADVTLAAGRTRLSLSGYASARQALYDDAIPVDGTVRARQLDATLERRLPWGQSLAARARLASTDALLRGLGAQQSRLAYLEYRVPFAARLPAVGGVSDLRVRVVDGATRRPIGGALVRRGDDVGVTARDGVARLPGNGAGTVELLPTPAVAGYAAADRDGLHVDAPRSGRGGPVTLALVPRARLRGMATLGDSAAAAGARVMLASARDTLFLTADAAGAFDAGAVPPGRWQLVATAVMAEGARAFATDSLDVAPGGDANARLTLRPRARGVRPLQVTAAPPDAAPPPAAPRRRPASAPRPPR